MIPKIIWTYWDNPEIPMYIQDCINTWKKHCKNNWSINILNKNTIKLFLKENVDYPKNIWNELPAHQSDMFGISLVNKYGGVWMDANIIMQKPIDFVCNNNWFGYYQNGFEIFMFASPKKEYTINKIYNLLFKIFKIDKNNRYKWINDNYKINDNYLFPQKLVNWLIDSDEIIKNIIVENSLPQWKTIYSLIMVLFHNYKLNNKNQVFNFLIKEKGNIPNIILQQPLLKLQGSSQQCSYKENKDSWWFKLTQKYNI